MFACIRSSWMRSTLTTSHSASSILDPRVDCYSQVPDISGQQSGRTAHPTSAPIFLGPRCWSGPPAQCMISPINPTLSPSSRPKWSRMVSMSSSPWVGCSCQPSPALITLESDALGEEARGAGGPVADHHHIDFHRLQVARGIDQRLAFDKAALGDVMLIVSALRRFSANSKEVRVRVLGSKKRLTMVLPRRAGTFLICLSLISLKGTAVSRTSRISSAPKLLQTQKMFAVELHSAAFAGQGWNSPKCISE